jgi:pilus assembly protein Flp/PilA
MLLKLRVKFQELMSREDGQDLVEYALVVGLLCFGATAGTHFMASSLAGTFQNLSTTLGSYTG